MRRCHGGIPQGSRYQGGGLPEPVIVQEKKEGKKREEPSKEKRGEDTGGKKNPRKELYFAIAVSKGQK